MTPTYFHRGMPVTADQLNTLVDWARRNTLTAGVGYTLNQSPGGTSLTLAQQNSSGGQSEATAAACTWSVSDASEMVNGKLRIYLLVGCWEIENTGRWPIGSSVEHPYYTIDLGPNQGAGWVGVYVEINVNQENKITSSVSAVSIKWSDKWEEDSSIRQRVYLAGVTISLDTENNPYVSHIEQYCPDVKIKPAPTCPFLIEDWSLGGFAPAVSVRSTPINRVYPAGMDQTNNYVLDVPDDQEWHALYCVLVTDSDGNITEGPSSITLGFESEYKQSTETLTYFLLGEVNTGYDEQGTRVIDYIFNNCIVPFISGAINPANGLIIPRARSASCTAACIDISDPDGVKIQVSKFLVQNRYPQGMGLSTPPFILSPTESGWIYCQLKYVPNDVVLSPDPDAIQVVTRTSLAQNEVNTEYVLIASFQISEGHASISNVCQPVVPNPCNLKWDSL